VTRIGLAVVLAAILVSAASGGTPARPGIFRGSGTIVFSCTGCPEDLYGTELFSVSASGRGFRWLATRLRALSPRYPRWSPDGRSVAFSAQRSIWRLAVRPKGQGRQLTRGRCGLCVRDPAWSPDGRTIVFVRDQTLFTMRAATGTRLRELNLWRRGPFQSPDWSPDGRRIAFNHATAGLYVVRADGRGARRLKPPGVCGRLPRWSPDGKQIAFIGFDGVRCRNHAVMVIRPDGKGLRVIVRPPRLQADSNPAWSPDGRHLLFVVGHELERGLSNSELWVVSLNGREVKRIEIPELPQDVLFGINGVDWTR
jgi:dipeptidyl aminopeptidase/acylaminoacyl peptidase